MHKLLNEARKPTLDAQNLKKLAEDASPAAAETFAAGYTGLLWQRVERIVGAVGDGDRETAMDASLSLKTASWLAGALRMNQLCQQLELALALADLPAAAAVARDIALHLPDLQHALASRPCPPLEPGSSRTDKPTR